MENVLFAFALTLFAGLATGIGSILAFFTSRTNTKFLSFALGFSAGVMIYVSMVEIFVKAQDSLIHGMGSELHGKWVTVISFFAGMVLIALIDRFIPKQGNPHELKTVEEMNDSKKVMNDPALLKMGTFTALAIAIHNFPEGIATFTSAIQDPSLGVAIAFAIAIHNIPEGMLCRFPFILLLVVRKRLLNYRFYLGYLSPLVRS